MLRSAIIIVLAFFMPASGPAQTTVGDSTAAISYVRTFAAPLSRTQLLDAALLAWQRTFGSEPASALGATDREAGTFEGSARINYRSALLTAREETMGVISYRVTVVAGNGECTVRVTQLVHTGNRKAQRGPLSFGTLTGRVVPTAPHPGISHRNAVRIWADIKDTANARIGQLLTAFGSVLRQAAEP